MPYCFDFVILIKSKEQHFARKGIRQARDLYNHTPQCGEHHKIHEDNRTHRIP
jgi:hypothetical protein